MSTLIFAIATVYLAIWLIRGGWLITCVMFVGTVVLIIRLLALACGILSLLVILLGSRDAKTVSGFIISVAVYLFINNALQRLERLAA